MSDIIHTQKTKIGPAHKVPHRKVWIEGKHLTAAGFKPGDRYNRIEEPEGGITLIWRLSGDYKVSGKGEKPIIDISGTIIPRNFQLHLTHVTVTFIQRLITICQPKS